MPGGPAFSELAGDAAVRSCLVSLSLFLKVKPVDNYWAGAPTWWRPTCSVWILSSVSHPITDFTDTCHQCGMVLTIGTNQRPETSCGHFARMNLRLISLAALSLTRGISSGSVYGQVNARNYSRWFKAVIFHVRMFLVKCCFYIQPELDIYFLMKSYVTFKQTVFELRLRWIDAHFKYCLLTKLGPFVLSLEFLKCLHLDKNVTPWKKESKIFYLSSIT